MRKLLERLGFLSPPLPPEPPKRWKLEHNPGFRLIAFDVFVWDHYAEKYIHQEYFETEIEAHQYMDSYEDKDTHTEENAKMLIERGINAKNYPKYFD